MAATDPFETELSNFILGDAVSPVQYNQAVEQTYKEPETRDLFNRFNKLYGLIAHYIAEGVLGNRDNRSIDTILGENDVHIGMVYTLLSVGTCTYDGGGIGRYGCYEADTTAAKIYNLLRQCAACLSGYTEENAKTLNNYLVVIQNCANKGIEENCSPLFKKNKMIYQYIVDSIFEAQQELMQLPSLNIQNQPSSSSIQTQEPSQLKSISTELPLPAESIINSGNNKNIEGYIQEIEFGLTKCKTTCGEEYNTSLTLVEQLWKQAINLFKTLSKEEQEKHDKNLRSINDQIEPLLEEKFYKKEDERREKEKKRREQLQQSTVEPSKGKTEMQVDAPPRHSELSSSSESDDQLQRKTILHCISEIKKNIAQAQNTTSSNREVQPNYLRSAAGYIQIATSLCGEIKNIEDKEFYEKELQALRIQIALLSPNQSRAHHSLDSLLIKCRRLDASSLFELAKIILNGDEDKRIQQDIQSAYYLALLAELLMRIPQEKETIQKFIKDKGLDNNIYLNDNAPLSTIVGMPYDIAGASTAKEIYEKVLEYNGKISSYSKNIEGAICLLEDENKDALSYYAMALYPLFLQQGKQGKDILCYAKAYKKLAFTAIRAESNDLNNARAYIDYAHGFLQYIEDKDTRNAYEQVLKDLRLQLDVLPGRNAPNTIAPSLRDAGMFKAPNPSQNSAANTPAFRRAILGSNQH